LYRGGRQKTLSVTLTYVEITSSGINCALKNPRGGKSRSGKVYQKGYQITQLYRIVMTWPNDGNLDLDLFYKYCS